MIEIHLFPFTHAVTSEDEIERDRKIIKQREGEREKPRKKREKYRSQKRKQNKGRGRMQVKK